MKQPSRARLILLIALVLVGAVLWSTTTVAQSLLAPMPDEPVAATQPRESAHAYLRAGDEAYAASDFATAELEYRRAAQREPSFAAAYNLGVALARQGRESEAAEAFARAQNLAGSATADVGDAAYNAGNASATADDLEASVNNYIDALRANPQDAEAKENLSQVLRRLRKQQEQEQQQQGDQGEDSEESQEDSEPTEEGQDSEPQDGEGEASESDQAPQPEQEGENKPEPQSSDEEGKPQPGEGANAEPVDVAREEAERLLDLARELERETQEKLKLGERSSTRLEKDW